MAGKLRVAVVGLGSVTQRGILPHLAMADARGAVEVVSLCDTAPGRAEQLARRYGVPKWETDYERVVGDGGVDAVVLATPIPAHFAQALAALEAGKHAYVQKTMTETRAEADRLIETAAAKGLTIVASPGQAFAPGLQRIKALIEDGEIGEVYWAFTAAMWEGHTAEGWRGSGGAVTDVDPTWYFKAGGGPLGDITVYALHNLTTVLGPVKRVSAMAGLRVPRREWKGRAVPVEGEDNVVMTLDFGGATFGFSSGQWCNGGSTVWGQQCYFGSKGAIEELASDPGTGWPTRIMVKGEPVDVAGLKGWTPPLDDGARFLTPEHARVEEGHVYVDIRHFAECAASGRKPVASAEHARHVIEVFEAALASARSGRTVELATTF